MKDLIRLKLNLFIFEKLNQGKKNILDGNH